jgi:protein Tex
VHQDGLVHISAMSKNFIKDPREVVKPGDIVKVKVLDLEVARNRIALTLRLDDEVGKAGTKTQGGAGENPRSSSTSSAARKPAPVSGGGALAEAMRRASEKSGRGK